MYKNQGFFLLLSTILGLMAPFFVQAAEIRNIIFPVSKEYSYRLTDSYGDPRSGGRVHEGVDIMMDKVTPVLAVTDGQITFLTTTEEEWGMAIYLEDNDGYSYRYLHINNDTPGSDDGKAILAYAFPKNISKGVNVKAGDVIAFSGDSGNAEGVSPHLHFEIWTPGNGSRYDYGSERTSINPYPSLLAALGQALPPNENPQPIVSTTTPSYNFLRNLQLGARGEDVKALQIYLNQAGFIVSLSGAGSAGQETNYFGPATQAALIKFQKTNNISPALGFFGKITRAFINKN